MTLLTHWGRTLKTQIEKQINTSVRIRCVYHFSQNKRKRKIKNKGAENQIEGLIHVEYIVPLSLCGFDYSIAHRLVLRSYHTE